MGSLISGASSMMSGGASMSPGSAGSMVGTSMIQGGGSLISGSTSASAGTIKPATGWKDWMQSSGKDATSGIMGANIWTRMAAAAIDGWKAGYQTYYKVKAAKLQANTQAYQAEGQAKIAGLSAEMMRSNKILQDIENRQQLDAIGRQQAAYTAAYREMQGSNTAQAAAGNVDVSSGSAAAVYEGNAQNYAMDSAAIRRAYDLQQWSGESTLASMEAQAKGFEYQKAAYDKTASAYRTVAKLQGSAGWQAVTAGLLKAGDSFWGTGIGSWSYS